MTSVRDLPIKHKLVGIIMLTGMVALLLACIGFITYEQVTFRQTMVRDFAIFADVFDDNLAPGLAFNDAKAMDQTLMTMRGHPHILAAAVFDKSGTRVATFERSRQPGGFSWPAAGHEVSHFHQDRLDTFQPITLAGERVGTLYIASDLGERDERNARYAMIAGVVLLLSAVAAYLLATRLQRVISEPILGLAQTASRVATEKNYALRATKHGEDELGSLVDRFNEMLAQIQSQELSLREVNVRLEQRVDERTHELRLEITGHQRAKEALTQAESFAQSTINALSAHICVLDATGKILATNLAWQQFGEANPAPAPSAQIGANYLAVCDAGARPVAPDAAAFGIGIRAVMSGEQELFELEYPCHSPTEQRWFVGRVTRFPGTGSVRVVVAHENITGRKQAEIELREAQQRLIQTSRQAGMAEVATSVLHNVGNVLNSVSVSAEVVAGKVRQSRAGGLKTVALLLREHAHDLPAFLAHDPRGKELPDYLLKLIEHLAEPQQGMLQELEVLRKNIEHIKEIVATQQRHARGSGVMETLAVAELVEDALSINAAGFDRHEVQVIREISPVSPVVTDRHKVLQILVNLVNNAKYALAKTTRDKQLIVRVSVNGSAGVKIAVIDNGVGIAPENLTRIFQHGFTTKTDGHGFGLHSGVLAAKELGGRLTVHSGGLGLGAMFTLELPLQNHKA